LNTGDEGLRRSPPKPRQWAGGPLLERDHELEELRFSLADAASGEGKIISIEGAAGLGKSRLLRWAKESAQTAELDVLLARGAEQEQGFSFGVALQLFEAWLSVTGAEERAEVLSGAARLALPLFEGEHPGATPGRAGDPIYPLLHGLFRLTANIAARRPLLIAVDDLQSADLGSIRFLGYLANRLEQLPVALAVTWRPGRGDGSDVFEELVSHPSASRLRLAPLSEAGVSELLGEELEEPVSDDFSGACFAATRGNPFFLKEVIRAIRADRIDPDDSNAARVATLRTADLEHQLAVRVSRLGEDPTRLASAVAVLGDGASLAHALVIAEFEPERVREAGTRGCPEARRVQEELGSHCSSGAVEVLAEDGRGRGVCSCCTEGPSDRVAGVSRVSSETGSRLGGLGQETSPSSSARRSAASRRGVNCSQPRKGWGSPSFTRKRPSMGSAPTLSSRVTEVLPPSNPSFGTGLSLRHYAPERSSSHYYFFQSVDIVMYADWHHSHGVCTHFPGGEHLLAGLPGLQGDAIKPGAEAAPCTVK
jgi:hypothetical protein